MCAKEGVGPSSAGFRGVCWELGPRHSCAPRFPQVSALQRLTLSPSPRLFLKLNFLENGVAHSKDNWSLLGWEEFDILAWSLPPPARLVEVGAGTAWPLATGPPGHRGDGQTRFQKGIAESE